ncbi:MAG: HEPN domain-containing protein [Bacteroidales bacterium]|nr:HEPN domain-containing protein [Bacteroidales bacterium]
MDIDKIIKHWIETSDEDFNTMLTLYNSKSYGWSLFLGHISIEKLLKALYVKRFNDHAPFTHNLYRLGELIQLEMSDEYSDWLDQITSFNLNARYDDYKKEFYNLCTPD